MPRSIDCGESVGGCTKLDALHTIKVGIVEVEKPYRVMSPLWKSITLRIQQCLAQIDYQFMILEDRWMYLGGTRVLGVLSAPQYLGT